MCWGFCCSHKLIIPISSLRTTLLCRKSILFVGAGMPPNLSVEMGKYPHMKYIPIVGSDRALNIFLKRHAKEGRPPDAIYVELPQFAGGHLGAGNVEKAYDKKEFNARKIIKKIREVLPNTPIIIGGAVAYRQDVDAAFDLGYDGVGLGTRVLLAAESGMPNDLIRRFYLNPEAEIVTGMISPAGLPSRYIKNPEFEKRWEEVEKITRQKCVGCIGADNCKFIGKKKPKEERTPYCIAYHLAATRRGDDRGLLFTGSRLEEIRLDSLYTNPKTGEIYIPSVSEAIAFTLDPENFPPSYLRL